jgi:hypothetical protein
VTGKLAAIALAGVLALGGCATVVAGGPDTIPISTNPPGAYVYVNGQVVGQTPMVVELDRGNRIGDIRIYYPGFQPVQITRYKTLNGWVFGNFFLMIWPVVIDLATGNWQRFDDEPIAIGLTPGQAAPPYGMQPQVPQQGPMVPMQPQQPAPQAPAPGPAPQQPAPFPSAPPPAPR